MCRVESGAPLTMDIEVANPVLEEDALCNHKRWLDERLAQGKHRIALVLKQAWTLTLLLRHPRVPWTARFVAGLSVSYLLSPIQLIPNFIPIIGQLDDVFVLFVGMKLIRKLTPSEILAECERQADSSIFRRRIAEAKPGFSGTKPSSIPIA